MTDLLPHAALHRALLLGLLLGSVPAAQTVPHPYFVRTYFANQPSQILNPTSIAISPKGRIWVASHGGHLYILEDTNRNGVIDPGEVTRWTTPQQAAQHPNLLGIAFVGGDLWLSSTDPGAGQAQFGVYEDTNRDLTPDGPFRVRIRGPAVGIHQNNQIVLGPDGLLYTGIGATGNSTSGGPQNAVVARFDPASANPQIEVFATGIRNAFGLAFDLAGNLFCADNGRDDLGPSNPMEYINHVVRGGDYTFPDAGPGMTPGKIQPIGNLPAHCSPVGMAFYNHARFPGVAGELLVMTYKDIFHNVNAGRILYRVWMTPSGATFTATPSPFVTNFGRIATGLDLAVDGRGDVYIVEYAAVPLAPERILKLSHPHLELDGQGGIGTPFELRTYGRGGDFQVTFLGLPAAAPIPVPPHGELVLAPTLLLQLDAAVLGPMDLHERTIPIPNDPTLRGARLAFQSVVVDPARPELAVLTNGVVLHIQ